jgi:hypothetical protein
MFANFATCISKLHIDTIPKQENPIGNYRLVESYRNIRLLLPITENQPFTITSRKIKTHVDASLQIIKVLENRQYDI